MSAEAADRIPPSREALRHHLRTNFKRMGNRGTGRAEVVAFIASLGEGWR